MVLLLGASTLVALFLLHGQRYVCFYGGDWAFIVGRRQMWRNGDLLQFFSNAWSASLYDSSCGLFIVRLVVWS